MSEVDHIPDVGKLVERLTKWSHVVGRDDISAILREVASALQSQSRRVEELEGALRETVEFAERFVSLMEAHNPLSDPTIANKMIADWRSVLLLEGEKGSSVAESGSTASPKSDGLCKSEGEL